MSISVRLSFLILTMEKLLMMSVLMATSAVPVMRKSSLILMKTMMPLLTLALPTTVITKTRFQLLPLRMLMESLLCPVLRLLLMAATILLPGAFT